MNLLILHLSDIHIKTAQDEILRRADSIGRTTFQNLPTADGVVILITGDIAFSGKDSEYTLALKFLEDIKGSIKSEKDIPIYILMCPGNHDCDFEVGNTDVRSIVIDKILVTPPDDVKDGIISECTQIQKEFFTFRNRFNVEEVLYDDPLWQTQKITIKGCSVLFHLLNVAWMSKINENPNSIVFPTKRFENIAATESDVTIVAFHHPLNWFSQPNYRLFRKFISKTAHLILTGHEHFQSAVQNDDADAGESVHIEGGVLQEKNSKASRFNIMILNLKTQEYSVEFHEWNSKCYEPVDLESPWSSFRRLPDKKRSEFPIEKEFTKWLSDAGARFTHLGRTADLVLDDIFVYPEMRPLDEAEKGRLVIDAAVLRSPEKLKQGVIIRGRELYGKTSLIKQLFRNYHERGFVPILLSGKELNKSTPQETKKIVEKAVSFVYGNGAITNFWQAGVDRRLLLLDDLDDTTLSGEHFSNALNYLDQVFGQMVITCSELFEFREYLLPSSFVVLKKLHHYTLLEFGHRRRLELIKRWTNLGNNTYTPDKTIALIDQIEKLVTSVIGEGVVPSTPFFMLTLLQSIEVGSPTNLQQSALGDYYRYLIIHSLEVQRVSREEHAEILNYCAYLAWFISNRDDQQILTSDFAQFHKEFVEYHGLSLKLEERERLLCETKLIVKVDGGYSFTYQYLYYFFLGKYLAEHLDEENAQELIRKCCLKLHKQDCGNIVLFLAHHSRDKRVYESILSVLKSHFNQHTPVNLDDDVGIINQLVDSTPKLIYVDTDPLVNREIKRDIQDENEAERRELMNNTETLPQEIIALISLLKTVDILGQFLKNHYGQLGASVKEELLQELFNGGLRGLRDLLEAIIKNSEGLIRNIENVLEKKGLENDNERRNIKAKKEMFELLAMITFAFIRRCGVSVASPHLARVIENVVQKTPSTTYNLIQSSITLESQGGLDNLKKLLSLNKSFNKNPLAQWILRQLVLTHMHLYSTTHIQKQKICEELNITIHDQHAIDIKTKNSKRAFNR